MKKTTLFLLGALIASVMPGTGLRAQQNVQLNVQVHTLDRASLSKVIAYAAAPEQNYFVDSAHLMDEWTGSALQLKGDNCADTTVLLASLQDNGYYLATATVDSLTYANAIIVAKDGNGRCYVLGSSTRSSLDTGYFSAAPLLSAAVEGVYSPVMNPAAHIIGTERPVVNDEFMNAYSSLPNALALTDANRVLYFVDTIRLSAPVSITVPMTINQQTFPVVSSYAAADQALVNVGNTMVSWVGTGNPDDFVLPAESGDIFNVNRGTLTLSRFNASPVARAVVVRNGASVTILNSVLASVSDSAVLVLNDSASAVVSTLNVTSANFSRFDKNATGILTVYDSTANATPALIGADAYYRTANGYRKYHRTLSYAAAHAIDSTVFLARNTVGGTTDSIFNQAKIDLNGNAIMGSLCIAHNEGVVSVRNGVVNQIKGADGATGAFTVQTLDSVGAFVPNSLHATIFDGRFKFINPLTGADVTIYGGKYDDDVNAYLPHRYALVDNTDADAASFRYKVVPGYLVTLKNFNGREPNAAFTGATDTVLVVNTANNRIVPAPSRPAYVGADTIYSAYYINPEYTTPWNFLNDSLTSDTTLFARWYYTTASDGHFKVYHYRQDLDGNYPLTMCDSVDGYAPLNQALVVNANTYAGFTADFASQTIDNFTSDTDIVFYYERNSYVLTYVLNGGTVADGVPTSASFLYGDTVDYPTVTRPGYTFIGWNPNIITMPAYATSTYALYSRNSYPVSWSHADTTVVYNGEAVADITATYTDDDSNPVDALLTIVDANGDTVSEARKVGVYTFIADPVDENYLLVGNTTTLTIVPDTVDVNGIVVTEVKLYDGNNTAEVVNMGEPTPVYGNDDLSLITTATYDNADTGSNKTITAHVELTGADVDNYVLASNSVVVTTSGAIVSPIDIDESQADEGIAVDADGYCSGDNSSVQFFLTSGNPNQYKLVYDSAAHAEGFVDVDWSNIATAGNIDLVIPTNAKYGTYSATLTLRNGAYPQFESAAIPVSFVVNVSRNYTMPIFNDVISIVDTCNCIDHSSVKWYHNGTYVGDGPYYQEEGGLTGTYHVTMVMNGNSVRTCEQDDMNTIVPEAENVQASVSTYPNPAVDVVNVTIENSYNNSHSLRVMNVMGVTLVDTTFEGESTTVDFSRFGAGSYTVSVDGIVARVIKY